MSRGHIELVHAPDIPHADLPARGWPLQPRVQVLSADPDTQAMSALLHLPPGWRRDRGHLTAETEWLLLSGTLRVGDELRAFGFYEYAPPATTQEPWVTDTGATLLFFARDRRPDFLVGPGPAGTEGRIELDSEAIPWVPSPIPGPPEGQLHKVLRRVDETGEMSVLCSSVPEYDYPVLEFHDCVEEIYMIEGDIWLGNSGLMTAGSYFWRPPFITHGPFYSRTGGLIYVWVPSTLVNHMPASAGSTPDENRAAFIAAGGERVLVGTAA